MDGQFSISNFALDKETNERQSQIDWNDLPTTRRNSGRHLAWDPWVP